MATEIEPRPYGPESTEAEREALKSCVKMLEERVLFVEPVPIETPFSVDMMFDRIDELSARWDNFFIVCEFPKRPEIDAETRAQVAKRFAKIKHRVRHLAMITDANVILRVTFKFVAAMSRYFQYSTHKSRDSAIQKIQELKKTES